jgi:hypothetical protein
MGVWVIRQRMTEIVMQATMLRDEPEIFVNRFWRDFYRALLSNAARNAMTKLLIIVLCVFLACSCRAQAEDRLNLVIAIDLTRLVAATGLDGKTDFQKNVEGVSRLLSQVPAGSHITVIGITDHSFAQPYILLSAHIPDDAGYFGERLTTVHVQLLRAWKTRSSHLDPGFRQTDILGALRLASDLFAQQPEAGRNTLVIFSHMRQSTHDLDLEMPTILPSFSAAKRRDEPPALQHVQGDILGVDGSGKSSVYLDSLRTYWMAYFQSAGTVLQSYSVLRELPCDGELQ